MKLVNIILICLSLLSFSVKAQDLNYKQVPPSVHREFAKRHPNMFAYDWEYKKKKGLYRAEFIDNGKEWKSYFSPDGNWMYTETEIKKAQLPQEIWNSLSKTNYQNWKVDDVDLLQTPQFPSVYKLEMKNGKQKIDLYFLANGSQVNL